MKTQSYIEKYENNKGLFEDFFGDDAKLYWKIWELHNVGKISYDKLALHYGYVKSSIKNICDRVERFFKEYCYRWIFKISASDGLLLNFTGYSV